MVHDKFFEIPRNIWDQLSKKSFKWKRSINTESASYDVIPDPDFTPHFSEPLSRNMSEISKALKYLGYAILTAPPVTLLKNSYIGAHIFELFNIPTNNEQAKKNIERFKNWLQIELIKRQYACMKTRRVIMERRREQLLAKDFYLVVGTIYDKCANASMIVYNNCIDPTIKAWNFLVRSSIMTIMDGFDKLLEPFQGVEVTGPVPL